MGLNNYRAHPLDRMFSIIGTALMPLAQGVEIRFAYTFKHTFPN